MLGTRVWFLGLQVQWPCWAGQEPWAHSRLLPLAGQVGLGVVSRSLCRSLGGCFKVPVQIPRLLFQGPCAVRVSGRGQIWPWSLWANMWRVFHLGSTATFVFVLNCSVCQFKKFLHTLRTWAKARLAAAQPEGHRGKQMFTSNQNHCNAWICTSGSGPAPRTSKQKESFNSSSSGVTEIPFYRLFPQTPCLWSPGNRTQISAANWSLAECAVTTWIFPEPTLVR